MKGYEHVKDTDTVDKKSKHTLLAAEILLCVLVIVNLLLGKSCYELLLVFFFILLTEQIQLYNITKQKKDFIAIAGIIIAVVGILVLYIGSFL